MTTVTSLTIHTDGGSRGNPGPAATGIVILSPAGDCLHSFGEYLGIATNNVAEYSAVLHALNWIVENKPRAANLPAQAGHNPQTLSFKLDSQLVVEQLNRRWKIKDANLLQLAMQIWSLIETHHLDVSFTYVPRAQNHLADAQVNQCLDSHIE